MQRPLCETHPFRSGSAAVRVGTSNPPTLIKVPAAKGLQALVAGRQQPTLVLRLNHEDASFFAGLHWLKNEAAGGARGSACREAMKRETKSKKTEA
jgi:hypothetical protein